MLHYRPAAERYQQFETVVVRGGAATTTTQLQDLQSDTKYELFLQPFYREVVGMPTAILQV